MSTPAVICLAAATAAGAFVALPVAWLIPLLLLVLALALRSGVLICLVMAILTSSFSATAWRDLDAPTPPSVDAAATLVGDPEWVRSAVRVEISLDGRHYLLWSRGTDAPMLSSKLAGERVRVSGEVSPVNGIARASERRRHVAAQINARHVSALSSGDPVHGFANDVRRTLERGAASMPEDERSLLTGFVMGDDRAEPDAVIDDFRQSGLSHLLAVSGENVVFLLLLMRPLLRSLPLPGRFVGGALLLMLFGVVTRWEPSVIRAEAMAAVVLFATLLGRPVSSWRVLALGTTAALLADPFLVGSIGFLLSVGACCGMALFGPLLARLLPLPSILSGPLAYGLGAQIGVMPVQTSVFGGMPLVAVPANLLAEPVAGFVMIWGAGAGLLAGIVGEPVASLLHIPTRLAVGWVEQVAHRAAAIHMGYWTMGWAWCVLAGVTVIAWWRLRLSASATTVDACE